MRPYFHTVQYYETDRMGLTHHSNYVRWMEEARIDFLKQIGWNYEKLEAAGIFSPVTEIGCRFLAGTSFPQEIGITIGITEYRGPILKLHYVMTAPDGKTVFEGDSAHCFLNSAGKVVRLSSALPELNEVLLSLACGDAADSERNNHEQ